MNRLHSFPPHHPATGGPRPSLAGRRRVLRYLSAALLAILPGRSLARGRRAEAAAAKGADGALFPRSVLRLSRREAAYYHGSAGGPEVAGGRVKPGAPGVDGLSPPTCEGSVEAVYRSARPGSRPGNEGLGASPKV